VHLYTRQRCASAFCASRSSKRSGKDICAISQRRSALKRDSVSETTRFRQARPSKTMAGSAWCESGSDCGSKLRQNLCRYCIRRRAWPGCMLLSRIEFCLRRLSVVRAGFREISATPRERVLPAPAGPTTSQMLAHGRPPCSASSRLSRPVGKKRSGASARHMALTVRTSGQVALQILSIMFSTTSLLTSSCCTSSVFVHTKTSLLTVMFLRCSASQQIGSSAILLSVRCAIAAQSRVALVRSARPAFTAAPQSAEMVMSTRTRPFLILVAPFCDLPGPSQARG